MKKFFVLLALSGFMFAASSTASPAPIAIKYFAGPQINVTNVNSQQVYMVGMKAATYISDGYYLGAAGSVLVSDVLVGGTGINAAKYIGYTYYGLLIGNEITDWLEWSVLLGGANVAKSDAFSFAGGFASGSTAFVGEIGVNFVFGMTTIGVSYREVTGYTDPTAEISKSSLSSISYNVGFKFGNASASSFKFK
jgi:hypothetical protein